MQGPATAVAAGVVAAGLAVFLAYALVWTAYWLTGLFAPAPDVEWDRSDVQVRVLTVGDAPSVVQRTVDAVPDGVDSVYVVSERPIDVERATVRVVDPEFTCRAVGKGRALEWARRTLPCEAEYVLFLDEDTVMTDEFVGLPDADVVQFAERPRRQPGGSWLAWLTELFRVGNGLERAGFAGLVPLYAWGGGLAVRKSVEDAVGWDRETIVEDSAFLRDAREAGHDYAVVMTRFGNQAPTSAWTLIQQRRRWASGRRRDVRTRPPAYRALLAVSMAGWPASTFAVPLAVAGVLLPAGRPWLPAAGALALAYLVLWAVLGWAQYDLPVRTLAALLVALPVVTAVNGAGNLYALVRPAAEFHTTEKADVGPAAPGDD